MATIQDVIDSARIYVDDNHKVTEGWKTPADWLKIARPEILMTYRKWVREGVISLNYADTNFTGPQVIFEDDSSIPLAIIGVAENMGNGKFRLLQPSQATYGRAPFWDTNLSNLNGAMYWTSGFNYFVGSADPEGTGHPPLSFGKYVIDVKPADSNSYVARTIPQPRTASLIDDIRCPDGLDDYIALRIARKALASEGSSSQAVDKLIAIAEAEWKMNSFGTAIGDAPKVRINTRNNCHQFSFFDWPHNPYFWYYPR